MAWQICFLMIYILNTFLVLIKYIIYTMILSTGGCYKNVIVLTCYQYQFIISISVSSYRYRAMHSESPEYLNSSQIYSGKLDIQIPSRYPAGYWISKFQAGNAYLNSSHILQSISLTIVIHIRLHLSSQMLILTL